MIDPSENPQPITEENDRALRKLAWAIEASLGEFKLFLARCNYTQVRDRLAQRLQQLCAVEIRHLELKASEEMLLARIRAEIGKEKPEALMVFGLETVTDRDRLLSSANQVREEFRKSFSFPLVLWVNDDFLTQMLRVAPDFHSWAIAVAFTLDRQAIAAFVTETANAWFADSWQRDRQSELEELQRELEAAQKDLGNGSSDLDPLAGEIAADLESLLGAVKFMLRQTDAGLEHYQKAAQLWQQSPNLERLGKIYREIAVCHYIQGRQQRYVEVDWQPTQQAVAQCLAAFEQTEKPELIADSLANLGKILRQLGDWQTLQTLAENALPIHEAQNQPIELARDYGFLAEVALAAENWSEAKELSEKSLEILKSVSLEIHSDASLYYFILAQTEEKLNQPEAALHHLEAAKEAGSPDDDTQLYLDILCNLQRLYFQEKQYLSAFELKLTRQSVEQQYGLRSFVGACRIQPQREEKLGLARVEEGETIAPEIAASGRMLDVEKLVKRIAQHDWKIIVIHGQSGVGKSSLVNGGLIPALKQKRIKGEDFLPVAVRVYTNWVAEFGKSLAEALADKGMKMSAVASGDAEAQLASFREQLQENERQNLRSVLIFDQFEEFFFVCLTPGERRQFFKFIDDCLNVLSVKVVLSLREDYLHYLLECDRLDSMNIIGNDILAKKVRYPVGNFSPSDAEKIIHRLTENSQFRLNDDLIAALVSDLAAELDAVRPIELQVVGAQLEAEKITTLTEYQQRGPKTEFVKRYLDDVVADCGPENQQAAELVLYLLTDENGTRPLKTRDELERDLQALAAELTAESSQLDLVLTIFVDSGLVLLIPEKPEQRYQLVHDYLAEFIRHQQQPHLDRLIAELERERSQRKLLEAERQKTEEELERERKAKQILAQANQKAKQRIRLGTGIFAASLLAAAITAGFAWKATQTLEEARKGTRLERQGLNALREFEVYQIEGLVSAMQVGQDLKALVGEQRPLADYPTTTPMVALHTILREIRERTQLQHQGSVRSASFSPDGERIVTASYDNTARVWDSNGKLVAELTGHQGWVNSASFSPDGERIVTASEDNTARVWDSNGKLVAELTGHQGSIFSASFSPDGERIVTASWDNTARVWRVGSLDELLEWGCEWLADYVVTHPTELEKLKTCQTPSNLAEAALVLVREGEAQAKAGNVDEAVATFRKALEWNPQLDFDPQAKAQQLAPEEKSE